MWQCRLCWTQNEPTDTLCQVCKKGVYPDDAVVAGAAPPAEPGIRRGVGAVIVPGGPAAPAPGAALPPPKATPLATPASPRKGVSTALVMVVLLLVLAAVVIGIALAAGVAVPWSGTGASALPMLVLPAAARSRPGSRGGGSPGW
jgi:hypothetical protein